MTLKKRYLLGGVIIGLVAGWIMLGGTAAVMSYTSSTEFCTSCHSMSIPLAEYEGSVHFTNGKGIRAECSDCHISNDPMGYITTKIMASKDIYHEYVTGKIDTEEKYEEHRMAMAETVWEQMRANDSATCRSCHNYDAMDTFEQNPESVKMHEYGQLNNQTCIDCHKGVAHFAPEPEMDSEAFDKLLSFTKQADSTAKVLYPADVIDLNGAGTVNPATAMEVIATEGDQKTIRINGWQMEGAEQVLYMDKGQRAILATLTDQSKLETGSYEADEYGNNWRTAILTAETSAALLDDRQPLWDYAAELDNVYCSTCHAKIGASHYTVNAWGPVARGMGERTDISELDMEILTKYFQYHAKDKK